MASNTRSVMSKGGIQNRSVCISPDDPRLRTTMGQQMISSCTGALLTSLIVTPFDVVKIRLQSQQKKLLSNRCFLYCNGLMDHLCPCLNVDGAAGESAQMPIKGMNNPAHFNGTVDAFVKISRTEGITALWSGLSPTLVLAVPATVVYFVSYEQLRLLIKDYYNGVSPVWAPLVAGSTARAWAVTLVSPLELIRTKMQSKKVSYEEILQAIRNMLHHQGVGGLWRGLGSTLLRDVPFSGIYWLNYETLKSQFSSGTPSFGFAFLAGAISGSIAATVTTPFDVVKTHQQIELGEKEIFAGKGPRMKMTLARLMGLHTLSDKPQGRGSSMGVVIRRIYHQNGIKGLFTGLAPRLVKVAPACAIMISTFEYGKRFFQSAAMEEMLSPAYINADIPDIPVPAVPIIPPLPQCPPEEEEGMSCEECPDVKY
ncbi:mitochondrial glutathione transporter SLC25A40 isoform X2 [Anabrus simplex]|uniref:mitochondrial glutathione transporter SLC25A40 isoform X2 n=1 Tax=Anabrus simplex TaxID=316456 RepID=UPI0034DD4CEC